LPIDKDPKRAESCAVANYDLSDPQQYSTLVEVFHAERESIVHAHCAPSCGTASRASGRKVPGMPLHLQPQPLFSDDYPDGLPNLSEKEQARVDSANASYKATADLLSLLLEWNVSVSIENPANSFFGRPAGYKSSCSVFMRAMTLFLTIACMVVHVTKPLGFGHTLHGGHPKI